MIIPIVKNDFKELTSLLEEKEGKMKISCNPIFNDISFYNDLGSELFLRSSYDKYIVIVRICLLHKRQGLCLQIVNWLMNYAKEHEFKGVKIESVCSLAMNNFCKKYNFERTLIGIEMDDIWYGDYIKNI